MCEDRIPRSIQSCSSLGTVAVSLISESGLPQVCGGCQMEAYSVHRRQQQGRDSGDMVLPRLAGNTPMARQQARRARRGALETRSYRNPAAAGRLHAAVVHAATLRGDLNRRNRRRCRRRAMSPPRCRHAPCHGAPAARKRERDTAQRDAGRRRSFSRCTVKHDLTSKSKTKEIRRRVEGRWGAPRHRIRLARGTWRAPWPHRRRCQRPQLHPRHETAVVAWGWLVIAGWSVVRCPPCTHRCAPHARPSGMLGGR
jgi:hypothetical protein